jgi:hypothetical protein
LEGLQGAGIFQEVTRWGVAEVRVRELSVKSKCGGADSPGYFTKELADAATLE